MANESASPQPQEQIDRMAYSGTCSNPECSAIVVVAPHPETPEAAVEQIADGPDEWEAFPDCYVCGDRIDWNGSDPLPLTIRD